MTMTTPSTPSAADGGESLAVHPRTIGWVGTSAMAMGGSNQSLFILGALLVAQGTAAIPLLIAGLVLAWVMLPGWIELVCMWPNRVGGIAATCAEAFRPYSPVLANLTGVSYWWGWVPTCGLTAILSASAIHSWYLPAVPIHLLASAIVGLFTVVNLLGIRRATRVATVVAGVSAVLALSSGLIPVLTGHVDWHQATTWQLRQPFAGRFGALTSAMAGLYLIGFAAPAFEAAACHVGETVNVARNVPRAMFASAGMATVYFAALPVIWLGVLGPHPLAGNLATSLGPTFGPVLGSGAKAGAIWFMVFNMFHGTLQPLAGASRTLSQLADDGLLPRALSRRNRQDVPLVATVLTAAMSIAFLLGDDPPSVIAAANFTYLIGVCLPSIAVWLLRRNSPDLHRPWRAPRGLVSAGAGVAVVWAASTVLGFEQYGLAYVLLGLGLAYSGSAAYAWRVWRDRRANGEPRLHTTLHTKLTGAMLAVIALDGAGYLLAVKKVQGIDGQSPLTTLLEDIFVLVALLTVTVGLVLPGVISHSVAQVSGAARRLSNGTLRQLTDALRALGAGDLESAALHPDTIAAVRVHTRDEVGRMAEDFNRMQDDIGEAAFALESARVALQHSREQLEYLVDRDPLTDLLNRRGFEAALDQQVADNARHAATSALMLVDLDNFKLINDTRGHIVGDAVLRRVADVMTQQLRQTDVIARLGGDEFAIVLPMVSPTSAATVAEALVAAIRNECVVVDEHGHRVRVQASVGLVSFGSGAGVSTGSLMVDVDVAMYEAKETGGNRLSTSGSDGIRRTALQTRQEIIEALRDALEHDGFELYAQPILNLALNEIVRYELLLRLVINGQVTAPAAFLSVAEHVGLIQAIDEWVVRAAFDLARRERAAGRNRRYSVNLSGVSVGADRVIELVEAEIAVGDVPGECMVFEITETAAIVDMAAARRFTDRIRACGCRLSLDDFGAGFGSFYYLKHLPFDSIKIDGDFIRNLPSSDRDRKVVKAIVAVADGLAMKTVAEFVEDEATIAVLRELGVGLAQGYVIGRPEPAYRNGGPVTGQDGAVVPAPLLGSATSPG